ncbi:MAG: response regulator [Spirochaetia bacterium]|nr:response regulator [Spirochaetia bacterium]
MDKILLVDDEQSVLEGFHRNLHKFFEIETALSSIDALHILRKSETPFKVIVSDLKMPTIDGIEFFNKVKEIYPDITRIMLTGKADLEDAAKAVNQGNIFRFLTKPCPIEDLKTTIEAGIYQYNLIKAEKILLEKTFKGSVKILTDLLSLASPIAFGKASRIARVVKKILEQLKIQMWEVEIAAMLSQIGCITIPENTLEKIYKNTGLSNEEDEMYKKQPETGYNLISNIPRLEVTAKIIRNQNKNINEIHPQEDKKTALGISILNVAIEYDALVQKEKKIPLAIAALIKRQQKDKIYNAQIIDALKSALESESSFEITDVYISDLKKGMIFSDDVVSENGTLLFSKGLEVTESLKMRMDNISKNTVIKEPISIIIVQ